VHSKYVSLNKIKTGLLYKVQLSDAKFLEASHIVQTSGTDGHTLFCCLVLGSF
jgi:hypothetical protein